MKEETKEKKKEKQEKQEKQEGRVSRWIGVILCALILPVLLINLCLIIESYVDPEHVPGILGLSPMIVVTKSMDPTIAGGDMIVVRKVPAEELRVGDVISFFDPRDGAGKAVTTHRITKISQRKDGTYVFRTKGDANNSEDPLPVTGDKIVGRYRLTIPLLGQLALFMRTVPGVLLLVVLPIVLLVLFDRLQRKRAEKEAGSGAEKGAAVPVRAAGNEAILPAGHDAGSI